MTRPLGPQVDNWPRPLPARATITGAHVTLEPMHRRHLDELFDAAHTAPESFIYLPYGPFPTKPDLSAFIAANTARHDPIFWTIRPIASGLAAGWISLMDIEPENAAIELGNIWFSPRLQRTRAATEAILLLLARAADELGYRRLVMKCDALNGPAIKAAYRLGFAPEGVLRAHKIVKGHERDTAMFSITADEWPSRQTAITNWLAPANFHPDGTAKHSLASFRG